MISTELRRIIPKAAGTYFIVRDNSQVTTIEAENKMRLFFINSKSGPTNMAISFAKGDTTGFTSVFGKSTRVMRKGGNFSIDTCLDALVAGPITVVNLRSFDDTIDLSGVCGFSTNSVTLLQSTKTTPYKSLFNTNNFWTPNYNKMNDIVENSLLNFGNIGSNDFSIFVVRSTNVSSVTSEGEESMLTTTMEIEEYPGLDFNMKIKDTIVDVYLFNNTFPSDTVSTNKYYGQLFDNNGNINISKISELAAIPEAGFSNLFTGSLIPGLISETGSEISINTVINQYFMETGLICDINEDMLEKDDKTIISLNGFSVYNDSGVKMSGTTDTILSHVLPTELIVNSSIVFPPTQENQNVIPTGDILRYQIEKVEGNNKQFITSFEQGIRFGDMLVGSTTDNPYVYVESMEVLDSPVVIGGSFDSSFSEDFDIAEKTDDSTPITTIPYTRVLVTCDADVEFVGDVVTKRTDFVDVSACKPTSLVAAKPRDAQFTNGTATRQNEILNMIIDPGIVKGVNGLGNIRYVVDCFKSFIEAGYKYQYGSLVESMDGSNRFARFIGNEVFVEDLEDSTNPLFKQTPNGNFDITYLPEGGNKNFSTKLLTKFTLGADKCFFFGPGEKIGNVIVGLSGKISNLFYLKSRAFDVLANETGIVSNVTELAKAFDDDDRMYLEDFNYNPIINYNNANRIFGNLTAQKAFTAQQQITNSELLAYVKENLFNLSKTEAFKKGNYDDYLRTETEAQTFMNSLATAGAIDPNPVIVCNASNNTEEIRKQKIKLVHVEYTPVDVLEKVVFDITIN